MARHDYNILNQLFAATRQDLNSLFLAMQSTNSGAGTPSDTVAYMQFIDTSAGEILMRNASDTASISLRKTTGEVIAPLGSASGASYSFGTDFNTGLFSPGANTVALTTSGLERLRIDSNGKVGIGTTTPDTELHLSLGGTGDQGNIAFTIGNESQTARQAQIIKNTSTPYELTISSKVDSGSGVPIVFKTASNNEGMRITSTGVGIGTTTPLAKLDVTSATSSYSARIGRYDNNGIFLYSEALGTHYNWRIATQTTVGDGFEISPSTTVGGTTWSSAVFALRQDHRHSIGTTNAYNNCVLTITQPTGGQSDRLLAIETPVTASSYAIQFVNPNGRVGTIATNGTSTAYNTSSDYRLKENIKEIENPLDRFMKLKPCSFNFITDKEKVVDGFLAHELQEVIPESVTGEKDQVDEDGEPIYQGIDQAKIVPLLVATVQHLIKKIEALESK